MAGAAHDDRCLRRISQLGELARAIEERLPASPRKKSITEQRIEGGMKPPAAVIEGGPSENDNLRLGVAGSSCRDLRAPSVDGRFHARSFLGSEGSRGALTSSVSVWDEALSTCQST
jgi:hypothetical protein